MHRVRYRQLMSIGGICYVLLLAGCGSTTSTTGPASPTSNVAVTNTSAMPTSVLAIPDSVPTQSSVVQNTRSEPTNAPSPPVSAPMQPVATSAPMFTSTEQAVAPEQNPVGDIPDNQAFVPYTSANGGYILDVPEGWARTEDGPNVRFMNKLDGLQVALTKTSTAPSIIRASSADVAAWVLGRAVAVSAAQDVALPHGAALQIVSTANSDPDPVTNKQVRLEQHTYLFFKNGTLATLTLYAPQGADNVDQWKRIAESFTWK